MKKYINGYNENNKAFTLSHITSKSKLRLILNTGLKTNSKEGNLYLFANADFIDIRGSFKSTVRDYIAYNELFMCEGEEAIVFSVDVSEQWNKQEIWLEQCYEPTENYQFVVKDDIPPHKLMAYETFIVTDPLKNIRHSNNKIQKMFQKQRHDRKTFKRTLINIFD